MILVLLMDYIYGTVNKYIIINLIGLKMGVMYYVMIYLYIGQDQDGKYHIYSVILPIKFMDIHIVH